MGSLLGLLVRCSQVWALSWVRAWGWPGAVGDPRAFRGALRKHGRVSSRTRHRHGTHNPGFPCACSSLLPQMIRSLKKAMAPVLSDVSVEWVFPESTEVLVSPVSTSCLFPGDRLVGYGVVCDTSLYLSTPRSVSLPTTRGLFFCFPFSFSPLANLRP